MGKGSLTKYVLNGAHAERRGFAGEALPRLLGGHSGGKATAEGDITSGESHCSNNESVHTAGFSMSSWWEDNGKIRGSPAILVQGSPDN